MPVLSKTSLSRLEGVDSRLQDICLRLIHTFDFSVVYGLRTEEEQRRLVSEGLSKTMDSKHLIGKAVDLAPYPIDWKNTKRFYYMAGKIDEIALAIGVKIRWGGDWDSDYDFDDQTFMDLLHFEIKE